MATMARLGTKTNAPKTPATTVVRVSLKHFAALTEIALRQRWTLKTAAEAATEHLAKELGIDVPPAAVTATPARTPRRRAAA